MCLLEEAFVTLRVNAVISNYLCNRDTEAPISQYTTILLILSLQSFKSLLDRPNIFLQNYLNTVYSHLLTTPELSALFGYYSLYGSSFAEILGTLF